VWEVILRRAEQEDNADDGPADIDLQGPEWQAFTRPGPIDLPDFTARKEPPPAKVRSWLPDVVLVPRLREVSALYGFTRIDSPEWEVLSADSDHIGPIAREAPSWVPCAQTRGEGIFLRSARTGSPPGKARPRSWRVAGFWPLVTTGGALTGGWCPANGPACGTSCCTPSRALIRELALECGYSASGIAERIYARSGGEPMAGIMLYTAAPDSEGTLGGLVSLGRRDRLGGLIDQALEAASNGSARHREMLGQALADARLGRFEVMLVWALDRVSREGVEATLAILRRFAGHGTAVWSLKEPWTETADPRMAELLASLYAWMAAGVPPSFGVDQGRAGAP